MQAIKEIVDDYTSEARPLAECKLVINHLACNIAKLDNNSTLEISNYAVMKIRSRILQFLEQDIIFKKEMAEVYTARNDHVEAAKILETIKLDDTNRPEKEKADIWLTIAENWFEADDSVNAEKYINKAAHVMHLCQEDRTLQIRYKNF